MFYIFLAIILFAASVMIHIFYCRTSPMSGLHAKAFAVIAGIFVGIDMLLVFIPWGMMPESSTLWGASFRITAIIIFILAIPIYLSFYVLTQLTSPSKTILLTIAKTGELSYDGILSSVQKEGFITSRLKDLCISGCVRESNGQYHLTTEGRKIAGVLNIMQGILGRPAGG